MLGLGLQLSDLGRLCTSRRGRTLSWESRDLSLSLRSATNPLGDFRGVICFLEEFNFFISQMGRFGQPTGVL